jgi:hypothetical protein
MVAGTIMQFLSKNISIAGQPVRAKPPNDLRGADGGVHSKEKQNG